MFSANYQNNSHGAMASDPGPMPYVRCDRVFEEPSAENAQGLFPPDACVFVGNLLTKISDDKIAADLKAMLSRFGPCHPKIKRDRKRGLPGAFVQFETTQAAQAALATNEPVYLHQRKLRIEIANGRRTACLGSHSSAPVMGSDVPTILAGFGGIEAYAMEQIPAMNGGMTIAAKVTFCFVADFQDAVKQFQYNKIYYLTPLDINGSPPRAATESQYPNQLVQGMYSMQRMDPMLPMPSCQPMYPFPPSPPMTPGYPTDLNQQVYPTPPMPPGYSMDPNQQVHPTPPPPPVHHPSYPMDLGQQMYPTPPPPPMPPAPRPGPTHLPESVPRIQISPPSGPVSQPTFRQTQPQQGNLIPPPERDKNGKRDKKNKGKNEEKDQTKSQKQRGIAVEGNVRQAAQVSNPPEDGGRSISEEPASWRVEAPLVAREGSSRDARTPNSPNPAASLTPPDSSTPTPSLRYPRSRTSRGTSTQRSASASRPPRPCEPSAHRSSSCSRVRTPPKSIQASGLFSLDECHITTPPTTVNGNVNTADARAPAPLAIVEASPPSSVNGRTSPENVQTPGFSSRSGSRTSTSNTPHAKSASVIAQPPNSPR